jgi:flagellar hook assembly protein FlgD
LSSPVVATIEINPKLFSPDNDGRDDFASIQYQVSDPGYVANVIIYDAAGRSVKNLVRNGTLGLSGYWNWDGLDDKANKLPIGTYVVYTEIFNLRGKKEIFKKAIVLARKLN